MRSDARSPYCLWRLLLDLFDLIGRVFSLNHAGEAPLASRGYQALNSARRATFLPSFLPVSRKRRDQEEAELMRQLPANEFARRRGRVRDCWRSENVREFYFSATREEFSRPVKWETSHQVGRWTSTKKEPTSSLGVFLLWDRVKDRITECPRYSQLELKCLLEYKNYISLLSS